MPLTYNQGRFTLFTLAATNAIPLETELNTKVGNYQDMVADGIDADLWYVEKVRYLGDSWTGIYPDVTTYLDGYYKLITLINETAGKFGFCAYSQGAGVCAMVAAQIWSPSGLLYHRRNDFVAAVMFGNPAREAGHTIPGGTDPGGHGLFGPSHRNSGTPTYWWDFANDNDAAVTCGDDVIGEVIQDVTDEVCFGDQWNGTQDLFNLLESIFFGQPESFTDLIPQAIQYMNEVFNWNTDINLYDPATNLNGHVRYHFPYTNLSTNTIGLSAVQLGINYLNSVPASLAPPLLNFGKIAQAGTDPDRFRFIVEEAVTGNILARDMVVTNPKLLRVLSGPCNMQFDVDYRDDSLSGIYFKPWGHWVHAEKLIAGVRTIWCSGIVAPSQIDKSSGIMHLECQGFAGYPKGLPALFDWNPLAIDVFQIVHKVWDHLQSFPQGNLDVTVYPANSGMEMLPGYAFDGQIMSQNFYAMFIRAADKQDCGTIIDNLARDIPFDYVEQASWNSDRSGIDKALFLGYPIAGVQQNELLFVINENVIEASPHIETEIDWASDVIIDGWQPGTEFSATLTNADPARFRRVISEDDAQINSNERAAAWAKKKLTRRQTPAYWESIIVDMGHPNAPFGSYDVGDRIMVRGYMPWLGDVNQLHKVIAIAVDEKTGTCELTLKAEGAFTYDPIFYQGGVSGSTTVTVPGPTHMLMTTYAPTVTVG